MAARELINTRFINDPNLQGYYRFEAGALTTDSSGHSRTLTNTGSVAEGTGKFSGCADFGTGNTGKYLSIANNFGVTNQTSYSISWWAKSSEAPGDDEQDVHFSSFFAGYGVFFLRYYRSPGGTPQVDLVRNNGLTQEADTLAADPGTTNWHHYVVTISGSTMRFYADGADQGATTCSTTPNGGSTGFNIGSHSGGSSFFDGSIDDMAIFNDVLTAQEASDIYNGYSTPSASPSPSSSISASPSLSPSPSSSISSSQSTSPSLSPSVSMSSSPSNSISSSPSPTSLPSESRSPSASPSPSSSTSVTPSSSPSVSPSGSESSSPSSTASPSSSISESPSSSVSPSPSPQIYEDVYDVKNTSYISKYTHQGNTYTDKYKKW